MRREQDENIYLEEGRALAPKKSSRTREQTPHSESEEENTININHYVAHPQDHNTFIGKVEKTRKGFRGFFFERPVSLEDIKRGAARATTGRPIIRDAIRKVKFAMTHLANQQHSQDVTT